MRKLLLFLIIFLSYSAASIKAASPTPNSSQQRLMQEEVIITARKRVERIQETPIAISAFSDEALKVAGIADIRDLQESVPGLNLS